MQIDGWPRQSYTDFVVQNDDGHIGGGNDDIAPPALFVLSTIYQGVIMEANTVLELCEKEQVVQVLPLFTDVLGHIKCHQIPIARLAHAFERGVVVDGSSVEGFARIQESDLRAIPDPTTFRILPWTIGDQKTGIVICDVVDPSGTPFTGDPRRILKNVCAQAEKQMWTVNVGPEAEFFYFRSPASPEPIDKGGYYDLVPNSLGLDVCTKTVDTLRRLHIECEAGHHEVAPSQYEIDLRYLPALQMADALLLYRMTVKRIAQEHGIYATFMPKPIAGVNGSGMHVHLSVMGENKRNLFFSEQCDEHGFHLSPLGRSFLAGILRRAPEMTAVTNPWINSYKRLVPGYEAPVYCCWGRANRSALIRVPNYEPGHEEATRIEARFPDPSCNPYLAFAMLIAAGLEGVEESVTPPKPVECDVYHLSERERSERSITSLPGNLDEALAVFQTSAIARSTLGEHAFASVQANIVRQLNDWRLAVTDWEIARFISVL
jgi:glutamine synthetase